MVVAGGHQYVADLLVTGGKVTLLWELDSFK
jgi:hypothetical protein